MSRPRRSAALLPLAVLALPWLLSAGGTLADATSLPTPPPAPPQLPHLLLLPGEVAWVHYSPGALDRAARAQEWLRTLAIDHAKWSRQPVALSAVVLTREEWEGAAFERPYGLPVRLGQGRVALPAEGDSGTVAGWRALLGPELPPLPGFPLRGTPEEGSSLLAADLLARFEASRELVAAGVLRIEEPWVAELAAALVAVSAFRGEPQTLAQLERLSATLAATAAGAPGREAAADLARRLGEHHAFGAALELAGQERRPLARLLALQKQGGGVLTGGLLLGRYPRLAALAAPDGRP